VDVMSGAVDGEGRLKAASGGMAPHVTIDSGLYERVWPLHQKASTAGTTAQVRSAERCAAVAGMCTVLGLSAPALRCVIGL
jgi:hypothetical protein